MFFTGVSSLFKHKNIFEYYMVMVDSKTVMKWSYFRQIALFYSAAWAVKGRVG